MTGTTYDNIGESYLSKDKIEIIFRKDYPTFTYNGIIPQICKVNCHAGIQINSGSGKKITVRLTRFYSSTNVFNTLNIRTSVSANGYENRETYNIFDTSIFYNQRNSTAFGANNKVVTDIQHGTNPIPCSIDIVHSTGQYCCLYAIFDMTNYTYSIPGYAIKARLDIQSDFTHNSAHCNPYLEITVV